MQIPSVAQTTNRKGIVRRLYKRCAGCQRRSGPFCDFI